MNRNSVVIAILALLVVFGLWQLLGAERPPRLDESSPERVGAEAAQAVMPEVLPEVEREVIDAPAANTASPQAEEPEVAAGLRGFVKELGGPGVPDVMLEVVDSAGLTIASTTSGENGRFAFDRAAPAGGSIVAQLASGAGPRTRHRYFSARRGARPGARMAAPADMTIWIPPPATLDGIVVDSLGQPVEGALVQTDRPVVLLNMSPWEYLDGPEIQLASFARTDAAGHFTLHCAQSGTHHLRASHESQEASVKCQAGDRALVLRLGTHLGGMVVIEGRLHDRGTGAPIAGAKIFVQLVREWPNGRSSVGVAQALSDESGYYEVQGLDVGSFTLSTMPDGYAPSRSSTRTFDEGHHTVDFVLDPARELLVRVVMPDGSPASKAEIHVLDAEGRRLKVPRLMRMLTDAPRVNQAGEAQLRRLPAAALTLLAVRGDLHPAGRIEVDLTIDSPESVTIGFPTDHPSFARTHYFKLLGPDGKPAPVEGTVLAESFDGPTLLSRVEGHWRGDKFVFGHEQRNEFNTPIIAIGAPQGACRVELTVPGYKKSTLTLEPGAKSPTSVRLER